MINVLYYTIIMKQHTITTNDTLKAIRRGNREAEFEVFGPGFHSKNKVQKSKRKYDRKQNKVTARNCGDFLFIYV